MDDIQNGSSSDSCQHSNHEYDYDIYYIKEEQFKLLLAGLGQTEWYGLFSDAHVSESSLHVMLADLYQNGVVDWDGEGVKVRQPYADMLSVMLEKKTCVTLQTDGCAAAYVRCCYFSDTRVVLTVKSQREENTIGMALLPVHHWLRQLEEVCIRLEDEECCTLTCRNSVNGSVYQTVRIRKYGLREFEIEIDQSKCKSAGMRCMREQLGAAVWGLLCTED